MYFFFFYFLYYFFFKFFFFNDTATTEIYTLSLHDALSDLLHRVRVTEPRFQRVDVRGPVRVEEDRKSTRLNSSHVAISYDVFCLKKKNYRNTQLFICLVKISKTDRIQTISEE